MAHELERATRPIQMVAAGRGRRPGRIITRDLRKKESLGLRHWVWVYNDLIGLAASVLFVALNIGVIVLFGGHVLAFAAGIAGLVLAMSATTFCCVLVYYRIPETADGHLSHEERMWLAKGERSRRNAPHAKARKGRFAELDFNYDQFSCDVSYEPKQNAIVLRLMKHKPWKDGRYKTIKYTPTAEEWRIADKEGRPHPEYWVYGYGHNGNGNTDANLTKVIDDAADAQRIFDILAEALEDDAYQTAKNKLMHQRIALSLKR